jgi:HK97 family phage portal protein
MPKIIDRIKETVRNLGAPLVFFVKGALQFGNVRTGASVEQDPVGGYAGWVYAAVSKRARRIGAIQLHLFELRRNQDLAEIEDDEVLALLDRVNPAQDRYQFFYTLELFLCLWGRAPILKDRAGTNRVLALWPLRPDLLHTEKAKDGTVTGYRYSVGGSTQVYAPDDIIFVREPSPRSITDGFSPLGAAALEVDTDIAAALWNKHLLDNFAEPGVVLETDGKLDEDKAKSIIKAWKKRNAGAKNAGAVTILDKGLKMKAAGRSPDELQLDATRKNARETIVSVLGVPVSLLTSAEVTYSNMETAERIFANDTLDPQARLITGALNEYLVTEFGETKWLDFESYVPENTEQKLKIAEIGDGRFLTVNEQRDLFGKEPLDGGDFIFKPLGVIPQVGAGIDPTDAASTFGFNGAGFARLPVRRQGKGWLTKREKEIKRRILARTWLKRKMVDGMTEKVIAAIAKKAGEAKDGIVRVTIKGARLVKDGEDDKPKHGQRIEAERMEFLAKLPRAKAAMKRDVKRFFGTQRDEVLANLDAEGLPKGRDAAEVKANVGNWIQKITFDAGKADKIIAEITAKHARENIQAGSDAIQKLTGVATPGGGILGTPFVHDFIMKRTGLTLDVNELTRRQLAETMREGLDAGEDLGSIRERISSVYDEAEGFRAETIARTEVGTAQNFGRNEEMRAQGVERKVWVAIFSNTREDHADADGQVVKADDSFDVGSERLAYPGDPAGSPGNVINCQCSVSPTLDDISS